MQSIINMTSPNSMPTIQLLLIIAQTFYHNQVAVDTMIILERKLSSLFLPSEQEWVEKRKTTHPMYITGRKALTERAMNLGRDYMAFHFITDEKFELHDDPEAKEVR